MVLLVGPPGAGKSTFCRQVALKRLTIDMPLIYVTTERGPSEAERALRERGLREVELGLLNFVDAYNETVGVAISDRPDTVHADCNDLSSIDIAISKLEDRIEKKGVLLVFDSLTSPYLFSGSDVLRFVRQTLSRFAARGNAVIACMDEGCGKSEDIVAMMSLSSGVVKMEVQEGNRVLNVVKHPKMEPTEIQVPVTVSPRPISYHFDTDYVTREAEIGFGKTEGALRPELGDFVNIAWHSLMLWSGMVWDPKRFPTMMYKLTKFSEDFSNYDFDIISFMPWHQRFLFKLFMPKNFSKVKDVRKFVERVGKPAARRWRIATMEYIDDTSKANEHYLRVHESYECWGFQNVGTSLGIMRPAMIAGVIQGFENLAGIDREWNAVETKCVGLGDPYCEIQLAPEEIEELENTLEKDSSVIEKVHDRLMDHLMGFIFHEKPLMKRPTWGSEVHIHEVQHVTAAPTVDERLQMVFRMGGARTGKMLGEKLLEAGLSEQEAVTRLVKLLNHCKVGKVKLAETIRMKENCERFGMKTGQPSCYFTTGFFNGFFYAVKNQHVREVRCISAGDSHCEWEFR